MIKFSYGISDFQAIMKDVFYYKEQLRKYAEILRQKYGDSLRVHSYGVFSIGFGRIVWEEEE